MKKITIKGRFIWNKDKTKVKFQPIERGKFTIGCDPYEPSKELKMARKQHIKNSKPCQTKK